MTVHPFRPAVPDDDPFGAEIPPDDEAAVAGLAKLLDLFPEPVEGLDELIDALDDGRDRFGSFGRDHVLAHRAVTPGLLAGLCWLDLPICQAFHATFFELLEDIGDFDGMIATAGFYADAATGRMRSANEWVWDHPAPSEEANGRAGRDVVADHSQELAVVMGSNPSLTFASAAAIRERVLEGVLDQEPPRLEVSDEQIDWLIDLTLRLLSEVRHGVEIVGGVRVWAAEPAKQR